EAERQRRLDLDRPSLRHDRRALHRPRADRGPSPQGQERRRHDVHRRRHGRGRPVRGRAVTMPTRRASSAGAPAGRAPADRTTHVLRASLKPKLYRDVEIDGAASLAALAEAIVVAFEFDFDHAYGFYSTLTGRYH